MGAKDTTFPIHCHRKKSGEVRRRFSGLFLKIFDISFHFTTFVPWIKSFLGPLDKRAGRLAREEKVAKGQRPTLIDTLFSRKVIANDNNKYIKSISPGPLWDSPPDVKTENRTGNNPFYYSEMSPLL
ncbi:hypothetical protein CEXT_666331 [Caerostris extrusa]|uniref:Uncharacterized protein n=1 Tax=Caerostris extrusa TaxID=172846 RepID=A0AAV4NY58_CAEEX|nr:hypothetical protein CEXT_666331 [Caerostris extrusa]